MTTNRKSIFASVPTALALLAVAVPCLLWTSTGYAANLVWTGDFETGDLSQYKDKSSDQSTRRIVTSPVRRGRYSTELIIPDFSSSSTLRAELVTKLSNGGGNFKFRWDGPEYWIGFSFLFKEWAAQAHTFYQIHAPNEPSGDDCDYAGNAFSIWVDNKISSGAENRLSVRVIENGGVSAGKGAASNNTVVHSYPFPMNEWQDYVVNFKLSTNGQGFWKIWKNGDLIYSKSGLTNVNHRDSCGNSIPNDKRQHNGAHVGIYSSGIAFYRRIFYDEVRIAEGSDGYDLVSPGESAEPPVESIPNPPVLEGN